MQMSGAWKSKVVLLGDTEVGKTTLITRFKYPQDTPNGAYQPTIGIDFVSKTVQVQGRALRLQLWDTAGDERYRALATHYLQEAEAVIVLFDIAKRSSFDGARQWVEMVQEKLGSSGDKPLLVLVGNKSDLCQKRVVTTQEAEDLAQQLGASFFLETSAQEGTNVDKLFERLTHRLVGTPTPLILGKPEFDLPSIQSHQEQEGNQPTRCRCWPF